MYCPKCGYHSKDEKPQSVYHEYDGKIDKLPQPHVVSYELVDGRLKRVLIKIEGEHKTIYSYYGKQKYYVKVYDKDFKEVTVSPLNRPVNIMNEMDKIYSEIYTKLKQ